MSEPSEQIKDELQIELDTRWAELRDLKAKWRKTQNIDERHQLSIQIGGLSMMIHLLRHDLAKALTK